MWLRRASTQQQQSLHILETFRFGTVRVYKRKEIPPKMIGGSFFEAISGYFEAISWARSLLGAEPWRNGSVARSELGLHTSVFLCGVRSVALRRARLWRRADDDWYKGFFVSC